MTKLQRILLMILKDVDHLMRKNGIPYFLDGGTALGAVRHKGFIPWDDDLDICILPEYYQRFVQVCREKLNRDKYSFEEGEVDWPLPFSKIKLNGTHIEEVDAFQSDNKGIYIDIFCLDYARKTKVGKFYQFLLGRMYTACFLAKKGYTVTSFPKKIIISMATQINKSDKLFNWIRNQVRGVRKSDEFSLVWDRTRSNWSKYFCKSELFASEVLMEFEGEKFPVCAGYDTYLTNLYGNYMKWPPMEKRVGLHITKIDYGKYQ